MLSLKQEPSTTFREALAKVQATGKLDSAWVLDKAGTPAQISNLMI
jgi:hypothetical protein